MLFLITFLMNMAQAQDQWRSYQNFCGPNAVAYHRERSSLGVPNRSIFCVKIINRDFFAFYQEGFERSESGASISDQVVFGTAYRQGDAFYRDITTISGFNAHIMGNHSNAYYIADIVPWNKNQYPTEIIEFAGVRATIWKRADLFPTPVSYQRFMDRVGPNQLFRSPLCAWPAVYARSDSSGDFRCVLKRGNDMRDIKSWFAQGMVNGRPYLHIGFAVPGTFGPSYAAMDICFHGGWCGYSAPGSLQVNFVDRGAGNSGQFQIRGAWSDNWSL